MLNTPETTERAVRTMTVRELYSRAQTGMAMANGEVHALAERLRTRAIALRAEADEIDAFLKKATRHTDSWYENIVVERDLAHRILKD